MKTLLITNRKGGVGKTTLTANIANEIAREGYLTILIDIDSQCDLTKLYLAENHHQPTILDVLLEKTTISQAAHAIKDNLYLIPGDQNLDKNFHHKKSQKLLKRLLDQIKAQPDNQIDLIIIDTPPTINPVVDTAYTAADHVLIVTQPETFAIDNMNTMMTQINAIKNNFNKNLTVTGIAINKVDSRRKLAKNLTQQLKTTFHEHILNNYISYDTAIPTSQHQKTQTHVRDLKWYSKTIPQFQAMAVEILTRMELVNNDPQN